MRIFPDTNTESHKYLASREKCANPVIFLLTSAQYEH